MSALTVVEALILREIIFEESKFKRHLKEVLGENVEVLSSDLERGYVVVSIMLGEGENSEQVFEEIRKNISKVDNLHNWRLVSAWVSTGDREAVAAYTRVER